MIAILFTNTDMSPYPTSAALFTEQSNVSPAVRKTALLRVSLVTKWSPNSVVASKDAREGLIKIEYPLNLIARLRRLNINN